MAKIDFKKLFADTANYGDNMVFKVGESEMTLGELRAFNAASSGELQAELQRQQKALAEDRSKVELASKQVAKLYVDLESEKAKLSVTPAAVVTDPLAAYEKDEVFRPVVQQMRQMEQGYKSKIDDLVKTVDTLKTSISQMGTTYMGDKARSDYDSIPIDDPVRPKDMSLDALYKFAVETRTYDRNNLPDLKEAYKKLTMDARHKHEVAEAEQRGRDALAKEIEEGAMLPRPVSGLPPLPEGMKPPTDMNDAFGKAATDHDLWKTVHASSVM